MTRRTGPRNLLHLMFDPNGLRPFLADWEQVAPALIQRISRESIGHVLDSKTHDLIVALLAYPGTKAEWKSPRPAPITPVLPVIPLGFMYKGATLRYFSLVTTVGTPQTIAAEELRIECLFPVDESTEAHHRTLMRDDPPRGHAP